MSIETSRVQTAIIAEIWFKISALPVPPSPPQLSYIVGGRLRLASVGHLPALFSFLALYFRAYKNEVASTSYLCVATSVLALRGLLFFFEFEILIQYSDYYSINSTPENFQHQCENFHHQCIAN